jgi:hypothetical protein
MTMYLNPAFAGTGQACQDADEGGFACAVGPQQAKKFAFLHIKADLIERFECSSARLTGRISFRDGLKGQGRHGRDLF